MFSSKSSAGGVVAVRLAMPPLCRDLPTTGAQLARGTPSVSRRRRVALAARRPALCRDERPMLISFLES
jgi:hypothetical protein